MDCPGESRHFLPSRRRRLDVAPRKGEATILKSRLMTTTFRTGRITAAAISAMLIAAVAFFASSARPGERSPALALAGSLVAPASSNAPANSKEGKPVLVARNLVPGEMRSGSVTITNPASSQVRYQLRATNLRDTPGPNGGLLSRRLLLKIVEQSSRGSRLIFSDSLTRLDTVSLGVWRPGERRTYTFTARLPAGGTPPSPRTGDNVYQGSSARVDLLWQRS
jgi:hypothetical protein